MELVRYWYGTGMLLVGNWYGIRVFFRGCFAGAFECDDNEASVPTPCRFLYTLLATGIHYAFCPAAPAFQIGRFIESFGNLQIVGIRLVRLLNGFGRYLRREYAGVGNLYAVIVDCDTSSQIMLLPLTMAQTVDQCFA